MPKKLHYNAADHIAPGNTGDPYQRPAFSRGNRARRLLWNACWFSLYRFSPRPFFAWRAMLLKTFGARLGERCRFYPGSRVYAPWHLACEDRVTIADDAELYNPAPLSLGSHAIVSQGAYVCGATHDFDDPRFSLLAYAMHIGAYAWICARASVAPGIDVGEGAVLGLASVATHDLEAWTVYAGAPAISIRRRRRV